jgi:hypothetical protein
VDGMFLKNVQKENAETIPGNLDSAWQVKAKGVNLEDYLRDNKKAQDAVHTTMKEIESIREHLKYAKYLTKCFEDTLPFLEAVRRTAIAAHACAVCIKENNESNRKKLEKLFEIFGDPKYADNLESLAFNAFPGMCTGDFWAHQYDQQTNQVLVNVGQRRFDNSDYANIFGLEPHYPCCLGNMHHAWPRFVEHMWMGTNDGGLIAMSYCPCVVEGKVDENVEVKLHVKSEYPFNGKIRIEVNLPEKSEFPLYFRIPSMKVHIARKAWISVGGKKYKGEPGTIVCHGTLHLSVTLIIWVIQ